MTENTSAFYGIMASFIEVQRRIQQVRRDNATNTSATAVPSGSTHDDVTDEIDALTDRHYQLAELITATGGDCHESMIAYAAVVLHLGNSDGDVAERAGSKLAHAVTCHFERLKSGCP